MSEYCCFDFLFLMSYLIISSFIAVVALVKDEHHFYFLCWVIPVFCQVIIDAGIFYFSCHGAFLEKMAEVEEKEKPTLVDEKDKVFKRQLATHKMWLQHLDWIRSAIIYGVWGLGLWWSNSHSANVCESRAKALTLNFAASTKGCSRYTTFSLVSNMSDNNQSFLGSAAFFWIILVDASVGWLVGKLETAGSWGATTQKLVFFFFQWLAVYALIDCIYYALPLLYDKLLRGLVEIRLLEFLHEGFNFSRAFVGSLPKQFIITQQQIIDGVIFSADSYFYTVLFFAIAIVLYLRNQKNQKQQQQQQLQALEEQDVEEEGKEDQEEEEEAEEQEEAVEEELLMPETVLEQQQSKGRGKKGASRSRK